MYFNSVLLKLRFTIDPNGRWLLAYAEDPWSRGRFLRTWNSWWWSYYIFLQIKSS